MKSKPVVSPVYLSATYKFEHTDHLIDVVQNRSGYIYSRWDNPTVLEAEKKLASIEGYDRALAFGSGMAAIASAIFALTDSQSKILSIREIYGGTFELFHTVLPRYNVRIKEISCHHMDLFYKEIEKKPTIVYLETPTNPLLRIIDIKPLAEAAHANGSIVILDSTFASPFNQHPVDLGVDIAIHSATKYLGGHHDITGGFACCNKSLFRKLWDCRKIFGGIMDPMTAFLTLRGMGTLDIRLEKQNQNAIEVAEYLHNHDKIETVYYPGLPSHPDHEIAKKQMNGFGGMVSFEVKGGFEDTKKFMDHLEKIKLATSLGGISSLANQPITNTHAALNPEERSKAGISESLVRLSVGIEDVTKLIKDLKQALALI